MTKKSFILAVSLLAAPALLPAANQYLQHNLVADQTGAADHVDPSLVNPWGICTSPTSPFWISDNGTGLSTLYNSFGVPNATTHPVVPATAASTTGGSPTGCVFNGTATAFFVPDANGKVANFLFATENGSLSGWSSAVNAGQAIVMVDKSASGAVYKGLAIATPTGGTPRIYAANFNAGTIETYDQTWKPVTLSGGFTDASIPAGFAPFNIQALGGKLYVTYAKQDAAKKDDVAGAGNGFVNVYDLNGVLLSRLVAGGNLNSPWGLAIAPANFGDFANRLLVGNFGDGVINAYDVSTGALMGSLQDTASKTLHISGLWALQAGNGGNGGDVNAVYFSAGPGGEQHGLLGSLQAAPSAPAGAVVNAASYSATIAPGSFVSVIGFNLAATQRTWATADFVNNALPTKLDGVSATINGKAAYVNYVSPLQINLLAPADTTRGPVQVVVTNNGLASPPIAATLAAYSPGFFIAKSNYLVANHGDNSLVGPVGLFPNTTPAKPGETIALYATGLGAVTPGLEGVVVTTPSPTAVSPTVTVGGVPAAVTYSGLTFAGVYQVNITVPPGTANGDQPVVLTIGGASSQTPALISVQN